MVNRRHFVIVALLFVSVAGVGIWWYWSRDAAKRFSEMPPAERVAAIRDSGGSPAMDLLLAALKDEDADVRIVAAQHLRGEGWRGSEKAAALVDALKDPHSGVRREAAEALCSMASDASPALCEALKHPSPRVRAGAALALGDVGMGMG